MKNLFCEKKHLKNEASVERCFVNRLLKYLGYEDEDIQTKESIGKIKIGTGSKISHYKPDYVVSINNTPVLVIDAKSPDEDLNNWTHQCVSYCIEINRKFHNNPVQYFILTNGLKTILYRWDSEAPLVQVVFEDCVNGNPKFSSLKTMISRVVLSNKFTKNNSLLPEVFHFDKIKNEKLSRACLRI